MFSAFLGARGQALLLEDPALRLARQAAESIAARSSHVFGTCFDPSPMLLLTSSPVFAPQTCVSNTVNIVSAILT